MRISMGPLAQLVEQRTFNPWVVGSIPTGPTRLVTLVAKTLVVLFKARKTDAKKLVS